MKQDELKADLALSKELSSTPRSKPAVRQYKPWTSRKKKSDEAPTDSSAHVTPDMAHVIVSEPIQATEEEIIEQPVVKATKKKHPQQPVTPSVVVDTTVTMETAVETVPVTPVESVPVEE